MGNLIRDELVRSVSFNGKDGDKRCLLCGRLMEFDRFMIAFHEGNVCQECFFEELGEE